MDKYLGCLFSFSCPRPSVSPGHPAGRSQDKPMALCLGFQCHLMSTWDQHAPEVLLWLVPCTELWQPPLHSDQLPCALCRLTIFFFPHSFASSPFLLQLFPARRGRARWGCLALPSRASSQACPASSSHHCSLWLTCAPTEGSFTSLLVIHRVWGALQTNRSHNCRVLEQPSGITSPCLHFYVSCASSL